jgi:pyruvate kinase
MGAVLRVVSAPTEGARLKDEKGLNFPESQLSLSPLTPEDLEALDFAARHADLIGYSYVQEAADIRLLQEELRRRNRAWKRLGIVAKVETPRAIAQLPGIVVAGAGVQPFGVMIARGDLAIEVGYERTAEMQEELLWLCEAAHIPVIWATQVLEQFVKDGRRSRGEMTDAAMSARAECVMLNKGPFVGEAVSLLDHLLGRMQQHQTKKVATLRALHAWEDFSPGRKRE